MTAGFFWLAIFPMVLGGIILTIYIFFLKREGEKPADPESQRITPTEFINEVARYADIDDGEAEKIVEFVFSYFPGFNWRKNLPRVGDGNRNAGSKERFPALMAAFMLRGNLLEWFGLTFSNKWIKSSYACRVKSCKTTAGKVGESPAPG